MMGKLWKQQVATGGASGSREHESRVGVTSGIANGSCEWESPVESRTGVVNRGCECEESRMLVANVSREM